MSQVNQHGLKRYIPKKVKQNIRERSKFGCVICRSGFYQYEHIDPTFEEAKIHNPELICCLCGTCHDAVSRGHFSKNRVKAAYRKVQDCPPEQVGSPTGPLDFHKGNAELIIGGLLYSPAVQTVLRYHGHDVIRLLPSERGDEPGRIYAVFTNDEGEEVLRLEENEWIGSLQAWDIEVVGKRIIVKRDEGRVVLQLRLDPPGRIVVEYLDMRFGDSHILVTEQKYAVGRYLPNESICWVHAWVRINRSSPLGVAIEFTDPEALDEREVRFHGTGHELATEDRVFVINANGGILIKPIGVAIAGLCGNFTLKELCIGRQKLSDMRKVIVNNPEEICRFISTGKLSS